MPFLNGKTASYARRVLLYGAALATLYAGSLWVQAQAVAVQSRIVAPVLQALAAEREARIDGDSLIVRALGVVLSGQEIILEAGREGIYTKTQVDRMKLAADREHRRLEDELLLDRGRIVQLEARRR